MARRAHDDPAVFCARVLGVDVRPFQARWLRAQAESDRTLVLAPRGHGKSTLCTVGFTLWRIARSPETRILLASATAFQAEGFLRQVRAQIESCHALRRLFGLRPDRPWTGSEIAVARRGLYKEPTVTALGVGGAVIGRHYDTIVCDDVVDRDSAATAEQRRRLREWFGAVLVPCLEPTGTLHLVGTRWHDDDLYGDIIRTQHGDTQ